MEKVIKTVCNRCGACACDICWKEGKCRNCGHTEKTTYEVTPVLKTSEAWPSILKGEHV